MLSRTLTVAAIALAALPVGAAAQTASSAVAAASKALGADAMTSITYSGTARNGSFGQSKAIGQPLGPVNNTRITAYMRAISFAPAASPTALVSRATGPTAPPTVPGLPPPTAGVFNQNVTGAQATGNWIQALNIWTTPWGFIKGAAANNATMREESGQKVISFTPAGFKSPSGQTYRVTGYLNNRDLVTKVETRVENAVAGDMLVEFDYSNYRAFNGVQVPGRIVQSQAGLPIFEATITAATPNPPNLAELLTPPPPPAAAPAAAAATPPATPPVEKLGDGAFKIGGNYVALAVDMGDHILVVESGQSDARGLAVMAAAKQAIPGKRIKYVVNSHPHFDHAGGLQAAVAEGAIILTHRNNEEVLERLLANTRALSGDSLSKKPGTRSNVVEGVGNRDVRRGTNGKVVELIYVPNQHSDGMLVVYLPAEKVLYTADMNVVNANPAQLATVRAAVQVVDKLNLDYTSYIMAHPPNPDRAISKTDVMAAVGTK